MSTTATSLHPLSEASRNNIVNDLVDSLIETPRQTRQERASITAKIARSRRVGVMQVAGVRAALTSESYGKLDTLKRRRRRNAEAVSSS